MKTMKPKPTMQMSGKALYCLGQHFKVLCDDALRREMGDAVKPCATCIYQNECFPADPDFWLKMQDKLQEATGISVNMFLTRKESDKAMQWEREHGLIEDNA